MYSSTWVVQAQYVILVCTCRWLGRSALIADWLLCTDRWLVVPCGSLIQHLIKNSSMSGIILKKISFSWICLRYFDSFNLVLLRVSVSRFCTFLASAVRVQCFARLRKVHNNRFADWTSAIGFVRCDLPRKSASNQVLITCARIL